MIHKILNTMKQVAKMEKPIFMERFFESANFDRTEHTIHTCNTAACVAGYHSLALGISPEQVWGEVIYWHGGVVANSIFADQAESRMENARLLMDLDTNPNDINHLNSNNPTAKDVVDYLELLIKQLNIPSTEHGAPKHAT